MIYSFLVTKSKFNFIKFASNGGPVAFDGEMATPAVHRLREAEDRDTGNGVLDQSDAL